MDAQPTDSVEQIGAEAPMPALPAVADLPNNRMEISHVSKKSNDISSVIKCLNFNESGNLLLAGSSNGRLYVWDWAASKNMKHIFNLNNGQIYQAKFLSSPTGVDIISAGEDGKVRRTIIDPTGNQTVSELYEHSDHRCVRNFVIVPTNPTEIISVGSDGYIRSKDLREGTHKNNMCKVRSSIDDMPALDILGISHHPFDPQICVSGEDRYVRVYDKRSMSNPVHSMCPDSVDNSPAVTCCVYNKFGSEILATYQNDHIYLFDNKNYTNGQYLHSYQGHSNTSYLNVSFFGLNNEAVISPSQCDHIFYWDKNTEAILNITERSKTTSDICLAPHPDMNKLAATYDDVIKIWSPTAEEFFLEPKHVRLVNKNIREITQNRDGDEWTD